MPKKKLWKRVNTRKFELLDMHNIQYTEQNNKKKEDCCKNKKESHLERKDTVALTFKEA